MLAIQHEQSLKRLRKKWGRAADAYAAQASEGADAGLDLPAMRAHRDQLHECLRDLDALILALAENPAPA